jgi:hypothetical protein
MTSETRGRSEVAYYTVSDAAFFPGAVALLNSLRLAGENGPLYVVDCGLTVSQRERLRGHATLVPRQGTLHPVLQKATGPLAHPAEIMVLVDADILLTTRPRSPLLEEAANGQIVGFEDLAFSDRSFPEWATLGLGAPLQRPYLNCGLLIFSHATASQLLPLFVELQARLDPVTTHFGGAEESSPFYFADQDILNAMMCTLYEGRVTRLEHRLAPVPPFSGVKVLKGKGPECTYGDGVAPYALHHILAKPWLTSSEMNAYSVLFQRVTMAPEAPLPLDQREVPFRLSNNRLAPIVRSWLSLRQTAHRRFRGKLGLRPAVERRVRQLRSSRQHGS